MSDVGVGSWIERRSRITPDRPALIAGTRTSTYADLAARIRRLANGLRGLGVAPGDRIAWLGPNHPAFLESLFAAGQLGAVLAPVNHRLETDVRGSVLAQTEPVVLIEHAVEASTPAGSVRHRIAVGGPVEGSIDYETLVTGSPDRPVDATVGLDDLLLLPHTSGTTGTPKAVMLTHGNVTWNAVNVVVSAGIRGDDVTVAIAPFFRVGGIGVNVLPTLFAGGTVVVPEDPTPDGLLTLMERHRATVGFANPDLLDALLAVDRWPSADLASLRFVLTGGAPVPERLIRVYLRRGVTLVQGYGLSEAAPVVLLLDAETALRKVGAAGRPPMFVDVRIVDADGIDVVTGQIGELLVRGPNVMAGYWKLPEATRDRFVDGDWLRTGDAAHMDNDGDAWIVDRLEARFVVGDEIVYPGAVERVLLEHPSVADVGVVGLPGAATHAVALVVPIPGAQVSAEDLIAFSRDRLTTHQVPASIRFVDSLPRNAVGKLVRDRLPGLAADRPGPNG